MMNKNARMIYLSIIVPVYNVEKYLSKCLDSLLCQDISFGQYEIIAVDDGSTDSSLAILKVYENKYPNVKTITQCNQGLSAARNKGIQKAIGKYIWFVDSDDYVESNSLKILLDTMEEKGLDALRFNYLNVDEQYKIIPKTKNAVYGVNNDSSIVTGSSFLLELGYACYVWMFVFRTEFILKPGNSFKIGIYFEDTEWLPRILEQLSRVSFIDLSIYNYLYRLGSITQSVTEEKIRKILNDKLQVIDSLLLMQKSKKDVRWYKGMIAMTVVSILKNINQTERINFIDVLKRKKIFPLSIYHLTLKQKAHICAINFSPYLYSWLIQHCRQN